MTLQSRDSPKLGATPAGWGGHSFLPKDKEKKGKEEMSRACHLEGAVPAAGWFLGLPGTFSDHLWALQWTHISSLKPTTTGVLE